MSRGRSSDLLARSSTPICGVIYETQTQLIGHRRRSQDHQSAHILKTRRVRRRKFRPDGTTHFTHVEYRTDDGMGVGIADYVTPELGELLCTLHNELDRIIEALRLAGRPL